MKLLFFVFLAISLNSYSQDCDYRLSINNATIQVLDNSQVIQQTFSLRRDNNGSGSSKCDNYRVFFNTGLGNNYSRRAFTLFGSSLNYNLHRGANQAGVLKDRNDAVNTNEYLQGFAPNRNQTYTNSFFVSVPGKANSNISAGYYYDVVQATIYSLDGNTLTYNANDNLTLLFYVDQTLQVSIIDEGGTFNAGATSKVLDFGILTQNAEKGADLRVVSNGSYQLRISSQNNGRLNLPAGDQITYSLRVNGSNVNLAGSSGSPVQIGSGDATPGAGDLFNLKVRITESTSNKSAGMYQDILTITAIAN